MLDPIDAWLQRPLMGNPAHTWLVALLTVIAGFLLGRLTHFVLTRWVLRLTSKTETDLDDKLVHATARPFSLAVTFATADVALGLLTLPRNVTTAVDGVLLTCLAVAVALILMRLIDVAFEAWMAPWAQRQSPPVNVQALHVGRVAVKIVAGTVVMVTVLQRAGVDIWSVVTGLGIGGVAVALAAQQTLGNLFGSLQVMTDQPFQVGDWIRIDNCFGRVQHIGLRSTRLVTSAGQTYVVPNKHIAEATIENLVAPQGQVREFMLALPYDTPVERLELVCQLVLDALATTSGVHPDFTAHVWAFAESAIQIRVIYRVPDLTAFSAVAHVVNLAIKARFDQAGLVFAFPTRTVHLVGEGNTAVLAMATQAKSKG